MSLHSFNADIAKVTKSILAAVIYENITFWTEKNAANGKHLYEGKYWTYNSMRAFGELFDYVSERQIRTALDKLLDCGLIEKGNFNKKGYDRTLWYCLSGQKHLTQMSNGDDLFGEPIPDNKPDNKPIVKGKGALKATWLSDDWRPPDGLTDFYLERGLNPDILKEEFNSFQDYWLGLGGAKARKVDWNRTWKNWIRRNHPIKGAKSAKSTGTTRGKSALAENAERRHTAMQRVADRHR